MSPLLITRDSLDEPMPTYASTIKSDWLLHKNPTLPSENSSILQQQDSAFATYVGKPRMDETVVVCSEISASSQSEFDESPNMQEWSKSSRIVMPDSPMSVLTVNAMVELGHRTSVSAVGWPEPARSASNPDILVARLDRVFGAANDETFEDGMDSIFSVNLNRIIHAHGAAAINALDRIIHACQVNVAIIEEALRQAGRMDDARTHNRRLLLLEHALESPNARIRDAASIGIEAMDDPAAVPSLQKAVAKEQYEQLRQNLMDVLAQLQDSQ